MKNYKSNMFGRIHGIQWFFRPRAATGFRAFAGWLIVMVAICAGGRPAAANSAPYVCDTVPGPTTVLYGEPFTPISFVGVFCDPDGDELTYRSYNFQRPSWTTFNLGILSGTPTETGTFDVTVAATDPSFLAEQVTMQLIVIASEMDVQGNGQIIADGDDTPSLTDHTDFGDVGKNSFLERTFTIYNTGEADLKLTGIPKVAVSGTGFSVSEQPISPISAPGGSTSFVVRFTPASTNQLNGTVSITTNDPDENPYNFSITGKGVNQAPYVCGTVPGPTTALYGEPFAPISFVGVFCDPDGDALTYRSFDFQRPAWTTFNNGILSGTPTETGTFDVTVAATDPSFLAAQVTMQLTVIASEMDVQGNGQSIADDNSTPSLSDHTDFGDVGLGNFLERTFTIYNTGDGDLKLTGIPDKVVVTGTGFSVSAQPLSPISGTGGSTSFVVRFTPASAGQIDGTISITTNDPDENPYNFSIRGSGVVTYTLTYIAGDNGSISGASPQTVNHGASGAAVEAVPNPGHHFVQWSDGVLTASRTDTNVTANLSVTAQFAINTYTVMPSAGSNGTISPNTPQTVNYDATTSFTVTPNTGYTAVVGGACGGALSGTTYTTNPITSDCTVSVTFTLNSYTVTPSAGANGSLNPATPQTVNHGAATSFTVTPNMGYHINTVTGCGGTLSGSTYTTGVITAACTVTASFAINTYTVTPNAGANGSLTPTTEQTVDYGATTALTVTPDTGYHIDTVTGCGGSLSGSTYTTSAITADCTVTATFAINTYTLTYTAGEHGSITGETSQTVEHGANGSEVTAVPDTGYHFVKWSDDSTANPRTDTNVTADITVTAEFEADAPTGNSYLLWTK